MWVYCSIRDAVNPIRYFEYQPGRSGKYPEAFLREYEGYIHTDAYSGYNAVSGVKDVFAIRICAGLSWMRSPKDIHNSEASKPAEAILRLNQLFNIESELEALPPDQKKKRTSYPRETASRGFLVMGRKKCHRRAAEIQTFKSFSLRLK